MPAPANDLRADAIEVVIPEDGDTYQSSPTDSAGATDDALPFQHFTQSWKSSCWWKYTPAVDGTMEFETTYSYVTSDPSFPNADTEIAVYLGDGTFVAENGDGYPPGGGVKAYTSYLTTPVTAGVTYWLQVGAYGGAGGLLTYVVDVTGPASYVPPPEPPTDVAVATTTQSTVDVVWTEPVTGTPPTSYEYRVGGGTPVDVGLLPRAHITDLLPSTTYTVEVRSVGDGGTSAWATLSITTSAPPTTHCFAAVRGSAIRITGLTNKGAVPDPTQFATSKSVVRVRINEITEAGSNEILSNPEEERRLRFIRSAQTIRHTVDIEFLRVDPGVFSLATGVPMVYGPEGLGFGEVPFGEAPFGGEASEKDVVGFDSGTRLAPTAFALEVWSKLVGQRCADGQPMWGYTLFPYLKGGRLSGFRFHNGLVSFNLVGAQTRRSSRWGVGPYDLEGPFERLTSPVSRNTSWRMFMTPAAPPAEVCGIQEFVSNVLDNGTAADPMPDPDAPLIVDGGGAETSLFIIDGGRA